MPRVHFVEKARKDNPICKKGESYYHWKFRHGPKKYSKIKPRPSQLTQSVFLSTVYDINDRIEALEALDLDELQSQISEISDELRTLGDEQQDNMYNMPDGLQQGDTGQLLERRADECANLADQLEELDFDSVSEDTLKEEAVDAVRDENPDKPDDWEPPEEKVQEKVDELTEEKMAILLDEVHVIQYEGD